MKKSEINKLDDKNLQLRYYLGGLRLISDGEEQLCKYWACDIDCSCLAVSDDERIVKVIDFIKKHNLTNERFIKLSYWLLIGAIMKYKGMYSPLFIELEQVLEPYHFTHTEYGKIPDNDFREKELEDIIDDSVVKEYCAKYQLDVTDFIILAKMSINYHLHILYVAENPDDVFSDELHNIINDYGLYVSREYIKEYRKQQEITQLLIDAKTAQEKYLELVKKIQAEDSTLATKMIQEGLSELGFNSIKDIKKLILQKR